MKKVRFLRHSALDELRGRVGENLAAYRSGDFSFLSVDTSLWFETTIEIDEEALAGLRIPQGQDQQEPENCAILYKAMEFVSPYEARDERLWTYLTHTDLLEYSRRRWPIPSNDEEAVAHIRKHFFARDKRQIERDNAASRLWWMAHLCARVPMLTLEQSLEAFLFRTDVRANIIERPTSSQSVDLFGAILRRLSESFSGKKLLFERRTFRRFMREINSVGGFKLLDCLRPEQIDTMLDEIVAERLKLTNL